MGKKAGCGNFRLRVILVMGKKPVAVICVCGPFRLWAKSKARLQAFAK
jgi:hypothetical protein